MGQAVMEIVDLAVYRRIKQLRKNNDILKKALSVYEYDKDLFHEILQEYEYVKG
jgi:hypothetical protein